MAFHHPGELMEPDDTCGYCGHKGHRDSVCPRRLTSGWAEENIPALESSALLTWHDRPDGFLAADAKGRVLGKVTHLDRGDTWAACVYGHISGRDLLGEYVTQAQAMRAVERDLGLRST